MTASRLGAALLLALAAPACHSKSDANSTTSSARTAPPAAPDRQTQAPASASVAAAQRPPPRAHGMLRCRAIDVSGNVTRHGYGPLQKGTLLDARSWLALDKGASVTIRHADSARELTIHGPAYATVCPHGEEEVLITRGSVTTSMGRGARPGAEVLVATPFATVSYGEAQLDLKVDAGKLELRVDAGDAWLRPAPGATRTGPEHVLSGKKASVVGPGTTADKRLEACRKAADEAARRAQEVVSGGRSSDAGTLGARAARHVRARQAARESCAVAGAAVGLTTDPAERQQQWASLARSERVWRTVPGRSE